MKKFIAIALTVMMLLTVMPFAIFAEGDTNPIKIVDADGNDVATYATLQEAVDAVTDDQKIIILEDYVLSSYLQYKGTYNPDDLKDVVIEGADKSDGTKVKVTCAKGFSDQVGCYNLTVRNLDIVNEGTGFDVFMYDPYAGGWLSDFVSPSLTVDNCTITAASSAVFKMVAQGNGTAYKKHNPFIVKIKDSTISAGGATATSVICVPWNTSASVDMTVENSTIMAVGGNATSPNPETSYVFCFNPTKGGISDISSTCNLTVDGTSKLIANFTNTATPTGGIFRNIGGTATINLAEGAELYVNNGAGKTQNSFIYHERGSTTINDNGAVWKVGADTAKNGITLPTFTENGEQHVWFVGETAVANPYTNTAATDDVVLTHGVIDPALNPDNICYYEVNGEKIYGTDMKATIQAAPDGVVIEVMRDFSVSGFIQWFGKNVTIDGNGHTITGTHSSYVFDINKAKSGDNPANYSFTLKDAKVVGKAGMWFDTTTVTVEGCTFDINGYMPFSHDGTAGATTVLTIKDSTMNFITAGLKTDAQPFMKGGTAQNNNLKINILNSSLIGASGNGTSANPNTPNNSFFNLNSLGEIEINIDATSVLKSTEATTGSFFAPASGAAKLTLNIAEGATFELDKAMAEASFVANTLSSEKVFINDNGANWVIGAEAAKVGVNLPMSNTGSWLVGGTIVAAGGKYINTEATESVTAIAFDIYDNFSVIQGAGLKIDGDSAGIAFGMTVSDELLAILGDNVTVGVYLVPSLFVDFVANEELNDGDRIVLSADAATLTGEGTKTAKFAICDIPLEGSDAAFAKIAAVGFISYVNDAGETVTLYTNNSYTASLYELAVKSQNKDSALVKSILALNA